jgi:3,4-dihydroxy 2-butanone 4-phosphate synthase/GTP cyclohydrolase II
MQVNADAAACLEAGGLAIVIDDAAFRGAGRGIFLHAAALATTQTVNTAIVNGRGITCFSVTSEQAMRLGLTLAGQYRPEQRGPLFLRSVEAADCEGTGISAEDRALTLRAAGAPDATMASLKSPGHVVPAMITGRRDTPHGELADAARDVLRHLTAHDVPAWTDILDDDGELAGARWCRALGERLGVPCVTLSEVTGASS